MNRFLMRRVLRLWSASALWIAALVATGCKKAPPEPDSEKESAASVPSSASAVPPSTPDAKRQPAELEAKTREQEPPVEEGGTWVDSNRYEFKLGKAEHCKESALPGMLFLGVRVHVKPKVDEFFVAPRHATLYDGGLRFEPEIGKELAKCTPVLKPTMLKKGQLASGFIVFQIPEKHKKLVLDYQPVRFGGAGKVRVAVPEPGAAEKQANLSKTK